MCYIWHFRTDMQVCFLSHFCYSFSNLSASTSLIITILLPFVYDHCEIFKVKYMKYFKRMLSFFLKRTSGCDVVQVDLWVLLAAPSPCHCLTSSCDLLIISFQCSSSLPLAYINGPMTTSPSDTVGRLKWKRLTWLKHRLCTLWYIILIITSQFLHLGFNKVLSYHYLILFTFI